MKTTSLLIRAVLYRKSQRSLAEDLCIPKSTLNRVLNGIGSSKDINAASLEDAANKYPMPEGLSPESSVQVNIPFSLRKQNKQVLDALRATFEGTQFETSFRMQEIRQSVLDGADYSDGLIFINQESFNHAKKKLEEFTHFKWKQGMLPAKYHFWVKHTWETIKVLETAYRGDFSAEEAPLKSGLELVFDLKQAIDNLKVDGAQKHALEFLLITAATQTAEVLYSAGYEYLLPDLTNIIGDTFGKSAESNFKLLLVSAAWQHNQEGMKKLHDLGEFNSNNSKLDSSSLPELKEAMFQSINNKQPKAA